MRQISYTYRILGDEEQVVPGDEWTVEGMNPEVWGPCDSFVGKRVRELHENRVRPVVVRRLSHREVTP